MDVLVGRFRKASWIAQFFKALITDVTQLFEFRLH